MQFEFVQGARTSLTRDEVRDGGRAFLHGVKPGDVRSLASSMFTLAAGLADSGPAAECWRKYGCCVRWVRVTVHAVEM